MEAQSYQHSAPPGRPPKPLRWLIAGVVASIALLIALPVVMLIDREGLVEAIRRDSPDVADEHLGLAVVFVMIYSVGLHLVDAILLLWLTPRVLRGRQWARIVLTAYLIIATFFSIENSAMKGTMFLWAVIPTDILHVVMITLMWVPRSVRAHFAAHRASEREKVATS
ncbi:MAG: hypothetical protein ACTH2Q_14895 [Propionibacteriaceae bacterium]